jgi:hypothetical protein
MYTHTHEGVAKSFRTESVRKYTLNFGITRCCPLQRVMAVKLTRLTHKMMTQLHLVAENCTIRSSRSKRPDRKLLDTHSRTRTRTRARVCVRHGIMLFNCLQKDIRIILYMKHSVLCHSFLLFKQRSRTRDRNIRTVK